ncbi:hypothetical protein [Eisenbergiella porci]|uniref:hypothetical protein n=1 Tax=Eisenbergiella porci TaxID=2652274 RepID=UPI002A7F68D0|nr:hypothetical protein [Eisenbergiella porci]
MIDVESFKELLEDNGECFPLLTLDKFFWGKYAGGFHCPESMEIALKPHISGMCNYKLSNWVCLAGGLQP